ncbi:MAG: hypothetical protein JXR83_13670 [Deltaproteobacteria bacterium]|nr:hypothetical protein [Deltaproteobacteria bacterium]
MAPQPCAAVHCSGHGVCALLDAAPTCVCDHGFHSTGLDCVADAAPCELVTCSGRGICGLLDGQGYCLCDPGFHNRDATSCIADPWPCAGVDCDGAGVCGLTLGGQPLCACDPGYGNAGPTRCRVSITPLAFGPTTPADGAAVPRQVTLAGSCTADQQLAVSGDLLTAQQPTCTALDSFTSAVVLAAPDGSKWVQVAQQVPGYASETIRRRFVLDTSPPALAFCCTTPAAGATLTTRHISLEGSCETGLDVQVTGDLATAPIASCVAGTFLQPTELAPGDGPKSFSVQQTDAAGNLGQTARTVQLRLAAVALDLAGPAIAAAESCEKYTVTTRDEDRTLRAVDADVAIVLGGEGHGSFYSDSLCAVGPITSSALAVGQDTVELFFRDRIAERIRLTATANGYAAAALDVTVQPRVGLTQPGGAGAGVLEYRAAGRTFDFRFQATGLTAGAGYTLIYFPEHAAAPTSGDHLICLADTSADDAGALILDDGSGGLRSVETHSDLPAGYDDRFFLRSGAHIRLVLASDVDCLGDSTTPSHMLAARESEYLLDDVAIAFDDTEVTHLVKKDAAWTPLPGSYYGEVHFEPAASTFSFSAQFRALDAATAYTLIYYHDPWPGRQLRCLGTGSSDPSGALTIANTIELDSGLPSLTDPNYSYAKIWLMRSTDVDCLAPQVLTLNVATTVFDYGDGLRYDDTDHPRSDIAGIEGSFLAPVACKWSSTAFQNAAFAPRDGSAVVWFTAKPATTTGRVIYGLASGRADLEAAVAASVVFDADGKLRAWHGGNAVYQADSAVGYSVGSRAVYRIRLDVDVPSHSYGVAVLSGEDGRDWVTLATAYPFRTEQAAVGALDALVFFSPTGDAHLVCGASVE